MKEPFAIMVILDKTQRLMRAGRVDISAVILISFVFQLLIPVVVLAADDLVDDQFKTDLRSSICQVHYDDSAQPSSAPSHTDDFVCDWCVICTQNLSFSYERPPAVYIGHVPIKTSRPYEHISVASLAPTLRDNLSAPRAPPRIQENKPADGEGFLKVPPRRNQRLAI